MFASLVGPRKTVIDFYVLIVLLVACAFGGGSSFAEVPSLLYVRPVAVICLLLFALTPARIAWRMYSIPFVLLAFWAFLMLFQLVPLPPAIWTALPGRASYRDVAAIAGLAQPWRSLSLAPDLTANSLVALVVPTAVLVGIAKLREDQRSALLSILIALCFFSGLIAIGQFAGGKNSQLYLYSLTYEGYPVGLLSNRNHQAALLSLMFPALRVWTLTPAPTPASQRNRQWLALGFAVFTVPMVLGTGSRAGIALMTLGIMAGLLLFPAPRDPTQPRKAHSRYIVLLGIAVVLGVAVAGTYLFGRAASIERLMSLSAEEDHRFQFAPLVLDIIHRTFPVGTGLGTFDPVFRQYEPDSILVSSYFNHAHDELLELVMTAGLPGLLLLMALLIWWGSRSAAMWRVGKTGDPGVQLARLGSCVVAFLLLASLVDYPLRSPLLSAVFVVGCAWLATPKPPAGRKERTLGIVSSGYSG